MRPIGKREPRILYGWFLLFLVLLLAAGRALTYCYSLIATDVTYDAWVSGALEYGQDFLLAARNTLGYAATAYAAGAVSLEASNTIALLFFGGLVAESAARFVIDVATSSITVYGYGMAIASLALQLAYETVFLLLLCVVIRLMKRKYLQTAEKNRRKAERYRPENAARLSLLFLMASRLLSETLYLVDFLSRYADITNQEIAKIVGSFLYIFVMYGGVPQLLCPAAFWLMEKITKKAEKPAFSTASSTNNKVAHGQREQK